jgi:gliding motility-associated-like protein
MKKKQIITLLAAVFLSLEAFADIDLQAIYTNSNGEVITTSDEIEGDAPLYVRFVSNASSLDPGASLAWHIRHSTSGTNITRYEEDIDFTFTESGVTTVTLEVIQDNQVEQSASIKVTIHQSHLEMPNAFSPNGDGTNDFYQAKSNTKSIVEFHGYIFNRWGQKLYEWTDCTTRERGWDGTYNGHPVKDGTYFVLVKARGTDGIEYNIRRDVNLMRRHNDVTNSTNE